MLTEVREAEQAMEQSRNEVAVGVNQSETAGSALVEIQGAAQAAAGNVEAMMLEMEGITSAVNGVLDRIQTVHAVSREHHDVTQEMGQEMGQVSAVAAVLAGVSQESVSRAGEMHSVISTVSVSVNEVVSASSQQRLQVQQVNQAATELQEMAAQLWELVHHFRLEEQEAATETEEALPRAA